MAHKFKFRIAYADTDAGGVAYHARYIEIAERARMDACKDIIDSDGCFVVAELLIKYKIPLKLNDEFTIETIFKQAGFSTMNVEQKFIKDEKLYATLALTIVYVNKNFKPSRIPDIWFKLGEKGEKNE